MDMNVLAHLTACDSWPPGVAGWENEIDARSSEVFSTIMVLEKFLYITLVNDRTKMLSPFFSFFLFFSTTIF